MVAPTPVVALELHGAPARTTRVVLLADNRVEVVVDRRGRLLLRQGTRHSSGLKIRPRRGWRAAAVRVDPRRLTLVGRGGRSVPLRATVRPEGRVRVSRRSALRAAGLRVRAVVVRPASATPAPAAAPHATPVPVSRGPAPVAPAPHAPPPAPAPAPPPAPVPVTGTDDLALATPLSFAGLTAPTSVWNGPAGADAPVDPTSDALVGRLREMVAADQAAGRGPWIDTHKCAPPIYRVPAGRRLLRVALSHTSSAAARALQSASDAVPLPSNALPSKCTDGSLVLWQPSTDRYWEFWRLSKAADGWHAQWGGASAYISSSPGYFGAADWPGAQSYWGTSATGLTLASGLMKLDDLQRGVIDHALVLALPQTRRGEWSWPAQRTDGTGGDTAADSIPAGARFRLDPTLDLPALSLPPMTRLIAEAAQRYGLIVTDRTSWNVGIGAESGVPYVGPTAPDPYKAYMGNKSANQILDAFPWSRLQLLKLTLSR